MTAPIKSSRPDGRGHWPAGKPRHEESDDWPEVRRRVNHLLEHHYRRGSISRWALGRHVNVRDNAVKKWLDGRSIPHPNLQGEVAEWLEERWAEIRAD